MTIPTPTHGKADGTEQLVAALTDALRAHLVLYTLPANVAAYWSENDDHATIAERCAPLIAEQAVAALAPLLAARDQATAAQALRDAATAAVPRFNTHPLNSTNTVADWLLTLADAHAATNPHDPTRNTEGGA